MLYHALKEKHRVKATTEKHNLAKVENSINFKNNKIQK